MPKLGNKTRFKPKTNRAKTRTKQASGKVRDSGYRFMRANPKSSRFTSPKALKGKSLPPTVDLRSLMTPVEDQGPTNSCTANAVAGSLEYLLKKFSGEPDSTVDVSRLFIYYNARWHDGIEGEDQGSAIQSAMASLSKFGICAEETWPFTEDRVLAMPEPAAYEEASEYRIDGMLQVPTDLHAWRECLAAGLPIVFGTILFESFDEANRRGGVVPMPDPDEVQRAEHGGHAMLCVGYSDHEEVFIVRNSWGKKWGDRGYCYIPYNYLMNEHFNGGDSWTVKLDEPLENPEETWVQEELKVTDGGKGVNFIINEYSVDDYSRITINLFDDLDELEFSVNGPEDFESWAELVETESWNEMIELYNDDDAGDGELDEDEEESDEEDEDYEEESDEGDEDYEEESDEEDEDYEEDGDEEEEPDEEEEYEDDGEEDEEYEEEEDER